VGRGAKSGVGRPAAHRPGYQLARQRCLVRELWLDSPMKRVEDPRLASRILDLSFGVVRGGDLLRRPTGYTAADSCESHAEDGGSRPHKPGKPGSAGHGTPGNNSDKYFHVARAMRARRADSSQRPNKHAVGLWKSSQLNRESPAGAAPLNECRRRLRRCRQRSAGSHPCQAERPYREHPAAGTACRRWRRPSG